MGSTSDEDMAPRTDNTTELRLDASHELVTVLDGVSLAQRLTRNQLVLRILGDWANDRVHEASVLARVGAINPARAEAGGKGRT